MNDHAHVARKRFGQNFLHDRGVIDNILRAIAPSAGECIVEIGPGQGALTWPLLDRIGELTVIEIDRDLIPRLQAEAHKHGVLRMVEADVLTVDFTALAAGKTMRLVGNLPYNISSPILFHALEHAAVIRDMHFMLQKEVVERMAAGHGSKVYGRLSVMLQAYCHIEPMFIVPPSAFTPAPKVESAIVRMTPKAPADIPGHEPARLQQLVRHGFAQRRKTLRNALDGVASVEQMLAAGIDPGARAEQVAVVDWLRLAAL